MRSGLKTFRGSKLVLNIRSGLAYARVSKARAVLFGLFLLPHARTHSTMWEDAERRRLDHQEHLKSPLKPMHGLKINSSAYGEKLRPFDYLWRRRARRDIGYASRCRAQCTDGTCCSSQTYGGHTLRVSAQFHLLTAKV